MKLFLISYAFFLLFTMPPTKPDNGEFDSYIRSFNEYLDVEVKNRIRFTDYFDGTKTVGMCNLLTGRMFINQSAWDRLSMRQREVLIWHEIGHCVCRMGHDNRIKDDGCPYSIMNKYLVTQWCAMRHRDHYREQFKESCFESRPNLRRN